MPEGRAGPFESCWQVAGDEPSHYMSTELHRYSYSLDSVCVRVRACVVCVCVCVCVRAWCVCVCVRGVCVCACVCQNYQKRYTLLSLLTHHNKVDERNCVSVDSQDGH